MSRCLIHLQSRHDRFRKITQLENRVKNVFRNVYGSSFTTSAVAPHQISRNYEARNRVKNVFHNVCESLFDTSAVVTRQISQTYATRKPRQKRFSQSHTMYINHCLIHLQSRHDRFRKIMQLKNRVRNVFRDVNT